MAIDINELNEWITTEPGQKWGDEFKSPLLKNRDDLLSELKAAGSRSSLLEQRVKETENELSLEKAALSKILIDDELHRLLSQSHVFEPHIPTVMRNLKEAHGFTVTADGDNRTVTSTLKDSEGKETAASLADVVNAWANDKVNWPLIRGDLNTGGGAPGSGRGSQSTKNYSGLSGRELAQIPDSDFKQWQQQELKGA